LTNPTARTYFAREAGTWVALEKHPNVVRCFHMEMVDNIPFLFLEWVAAEEGYCADLRDWLHRRGPLEPRRALEFTLDVCRALRHAQYKVSSFVYCDIKPANVLVDQGQLAKLTDFGLARLVRETGQVPYAIRIDPNLAQAHSNRGITYMALGRHTEALIDYEAAIGLDPEYATAYVNKGVLHTERDEWDDALRAFETATRLGNNTGKQ
jgi:serine/threonine protein kinase